MDSEQQNLTPGPKKPNKSLWTAGGIAGLVIVVLIGLVVFMGLKNKSLQDEVKKLAGEGRGRKTVVSVSEKPVAGATVAKSQGAADGLSANEFMAKALAAQASGRLTGLDVARAESALNKGLPVPQDVVNRVIQ